MAEDFSTSDKSPNTKFSQGPRITLCWRIVAALRLKHNSPKHTSKQRVPHPRYWPQTEAEGTPGQFSPPRQTLRRPTAQPAERRGEKGHLGTAVRSGGLTSLLRGSQGLN